MGMTATERLRALLDERGVEYLDMHGIIEFRGKNDRTVRCYQRPEPLTLDVAIIAAPPEQAIAATLGDSDAVEVVRCRDCKFYTPESMTREERGFGVYENVWEPGGCFNPERCSATWDSIVGQMVPVGINTEPDGFCVWGERRADG